MIKIILIVYAILAILYLFVLSKCAAEFDNVISFLISLFLCILISLLWPIVAVIFSILYLLNND